MSDDYKEDIKMARGFNPMGGMGGMNMQNLMKQAQKMQRQMEEVQASLDDKTLETTSGGGAVKIVINGKKVISDFLDGVVGGAGCDT